MNSNLLRIAQKFKEGKMKKTMSTKSRLELFLELLKAEREGRLSSDPVMMTRFRKLTKQQNCIKVRDMISKLQKKSGAIIKPIAFGKQFYNYLCEKYPTNKMNIDRARTMAEVFAILCNEYYVHGLRYDLKSAFFVTEKTWLKMLIGRKARENSIKILKEIGLINYYNIVDKEYKIRRRFYEINVEKFDSFFNKEHYNVNFDEDEFDKYFYDDDEDFEN